ncbi:MAG: fatty acid-binding protein DegV [Haloplasmataceae bacterium]|jgi:DegV family protein with EDD domain|nr:fatty acid-binding protein DegV [Haloplasmataceae bacterium]
MKKVVIVTDSTSDLTQDIISQYNLKVLPLYVGFGNNTYKDGVEINTEELYKKVDENGSLPKTSAPSIGDFYQFFESLINEEKDIVYVGISSKLSVTHQNSLLAAAEFPEGRIHCVDSLNLSSGVGLLAMKAAKFAEAGLSAKEIAEKVREIVPKVHTSFVIDTLDYLHKGGRCSSLANYMSLVLNIKPIIHVLNGGMEVGQKPIGKKKGLKILLSQIIGDKEVLDSEFVMVTHSIAETEAEYLKTELKANLKIENLYETKAGCVISSHCGKGCIGILYITK